MAKEGKPAAPALYVIVMGGVVVQIATNDPALQSIPVRIVDYDVEQGDANLRRFAINENELEDVFLAEERPILLEMRID